MAVWASGIQDIACFKKAVLSDVKFTHSNEVAQDATFVYELGIKFLLNNPSR